jgi:hypothetical protein
MAYSASIPYGGLSFGYAKQVNAGSSPRTSPNWQDDAITQTAKTDHAITFLNTLEDGVTYWIYLTPSGNPVASDQFLQVVGPPSALIQAIDNNVVSLLQMQVGNGTAIEAFTTAGGTRLVVAIQGSVTGSVNGFTITASGGAVTVLDFELKKISTHEVTAVILRLSRTIAASERVHVGYTSNPGSGGGNLSVDASFVPSFSNLLVRTEAGIDALLQPIKAKTDIIGTQSEITVTTPVIPTKWRVFAFSRITNDPVLGDANNITAKLAIDHAGPVALEDLHPVEIEDGYYYFDLSTSEQTGAVFELFPESSTAGVQVIGVPGRMESNAMLRAIEAKTELIGTGAALIGRLTWDTPGTLNFELLTSSTDQVLSITLLNEDESPANLTGLVLTAVIESHDRSDIVTVADDDIARSGNVITFSIPGAMLEIARTLRWSLRSGGGAILVGRIVVRYAATVDPTP